MVIISIIILFTTANIIIIIQHIIDSENKNTMIVVTRQAVLAYIQFIQYQAVQHPHHHHRLQNHHHSRHHHHYQDHKVNPQFLTTQGHCLNGFSFHVGSNRMLT